MKYVFFILSILLTSCVTCEVVVDIDKKEVEDYQDNIESHHEMREIESPEIENDTLEFDVHKPHNPH